MAKYDATGTVLAFGNSTGGASSTYTTVAQVQTYGSGPGGGTTSEIDTTTHDSSGGYREFVQGLKDGGSMDFTIMYDPAHASHNDATGLAGLYADGTESDWKMTLTDTASSAIEFVGYVSQFQPVTPLDGPLTANVSIRINGAVTFP